MALRHLCADERMFFLPPFHTFMSWRVHLLLCTYGWKDVEWNESNWASCNSCLLLLYNKLRHFNKINDEVMLRNWSGKISKKVIKKLNLNNLKKFMKIFIFFNFKFLRKKLHSKVIKIYWQSDKKYIIISHYSIFSRVPYNENWS